MPSTLTVPVVNIGPIREHPNADRLEVAEVLGYQMVVPKGRYTEGDKCVYVPADSIVTPEWAERWGVMQFLRGKEKNRVGQVRLRGEPSFGLIVPIPEGQDWEVGTNTCEFFGIEKYVPPIRPSIGDEAKYDEDIDPHFTKYTHIENGRIHVGVLEDGEEVVACEKLHGTNSRLGWVYGEVVAGSHMTRRKCPVDIKSVDLTQPVPEIQSHTYWYPFSIEAVQNLLTALSKGHKVVVLFGEVYGGSVQSLHYGIPKGKGFGYRAFDLYVDGRYLDFHDFRQTCERFGVDMAPLLYQGPFSLERAKELADGQSAVTATKQMREGIVCRPLKERTHPKVGRVIMKYVGTEYSLSKKKEYRDDV